MKKIVFNKYSLIIGTVIIALIFAFLTSEIYERTLDDTKKDHQLQQLEMSKTVAKEIREQVKWFEDNYEWVDVEVPARPATTRKEFVYKG